MCCVWDLFLLLHRVRSEEECAAVGIVYSHRICSHRARSEEECAAVSSVYSHNFCSHRDRSEEECAAVCSVYSQTVYNTKGTRAHTHMELIRVWRSEPKGSSHSHLLVHTVSAARRSARRLAPSIHTSSVYTVPEASRSALPSAPSIHTSFVHTVPARAWEVARTVVTPPSSVVKWGGVCLGVWGDVLVVCVCVCCRGCCSL